jgi:LysW-gamma-L-lysine carboxypeptidase
VDQPQPATQITDADAIDLLHRMVATPSLSRQEQAVATVIRDWALSQGLRGEVDDTGNAVVSLGNPNAEHLIVCLGHMDTFPGMPRVRIEDGILYGRGSVDAKGPLAAFVVGAARATLPSNVRVMVVGAVEEECPTSRGAIAISKRVRPDACIIGEPSGTTGVTLGYKGRLLADISVCRPSAHSAGPGSSASDDAVAWWGRVLALVHELNSGHTGAFDTIQATIRSMSSEQTGVEDRAILAAGFRLPPWLSPERLTTLLRELDDQVTLECTGAERAVVSDRSNRVVRALTQAIRATGVIPAVRVKTGTSDMNVVAPIWNCPIAAYGPGDSALDHTPNEHLHLEEFARSIRVLTDAIERMAREMASQDGSSLVNEA